MDKETLRMQMLAGVITESEYAAIINKEIEEADKESLNESMIGGIVGIGAINQIPPREKADYELAYEHYLGAKHLTEDETTDMENKVDEETGVSEAEMGEENPIDSISMDVPLFIRMLEFAREDASTDMDLHDLAEKAISMSAEGNILSMDNYEDLVGDKTEAEEI
jgi:hypothetical protein